MSDLDPYGPPLIEQALMDVDRFIRICEWYGWDPLKMLLGETRAKRDDPA